MEFRNHLQKFTKIYNEVINFIENEYDVSDIKIEFDLNNNKSELIELLRIIFHISNNHHRSPHFFDRIQEIFEIIEEEIKKNISNIELFNMFKGNNRILLILFEKEFIKIDEIIAGKLIKSKNNSYFYPEIKTFLTNTNKITIEDELDVFNEKRQKGENDSYICELIRNDSVEEFITYVTKNNLSLLSTIKASIYETNSFLLSNNDVSLSEYSAFYGSIQIFKYLSLNGIKLNSSLWLFAVHGKNPEMIHYLEEYFFNEIDFPFKNCLYESIKCHHNDFAEYFYQNEKIDDFSKILEFFNFKFFPTEMNEKIFCDLCRFGYNSFVKILLNTSKLDVNYITSFLRETNNVT